MPYRRCKLLAAVTLIEVMAAIVIVSVAVLGASGYRYYSALDAKRADMQGAAARIALLLCENWRGRGIDRTTTYDPIDHLDDELEIRASSAGPDYPSGFTPLGRYEITVDNVRYWAELSWKDDGADLRMLNVVVAWAQRQTGSADVAAAAGLDKTFKLTTYVSE